MRDYSVLRKDIISNSTELYVMVLSLLVLTSVLQRNVFFSNSELFVKTANAFEVVIYFILVVIIVKKDYSIKVLIASALLALILLVGFLKSGMAVYFRALLLIIASRKINFDKILKAILFSTFLAIFISTFFYVLGLAPDSVSIWHFEGYGFGFGGGNSLGELLCLCNMIICYLKVKRKQSINFFIEIICTVAIYLVTTSKTATFIFAFTPVLIVVFDKVLKKKHTTFLRFLIYLVNPILFVFSYGSAKLFLSNSIVQKMDEILTNRFFLNHYALSKYGLALFGQKVFLHDTGVYNPVRGIGNITVTVDNAYVLSLISMGIIPTLVFIFGYYLIIRKALKEKNYALCAVAVLLCLYGFTEVKTIEVYDNFVYLSLLTCTSPPFENTYSQDTNSDAIEINDLRKKKVIYDS